MRPPPWTEPLQGELAKHRHKRVRMHCGRPGCGVALDTLIAFEMHSHERGELLYRFVSGEGGFTVTGRRTSRPQVKHGPAPSGGIDGNPVMLWECSCGAVYKIGRQRLASLFLDAARRGRRRVSITA